MVYMLTLGYIDGIHVTIYGSTMDPMGIDPTVPHELCGKTLTARATFEDVFGRGIRGTRPQVSDASGPSAQRASSVDDG